MLEPFLGEIAMFPYGRIPRGWAECNGQILSTSQYQALFSLLGNTYGGDAKTTFGLPNLNGRMVIHPDGVKYFLGGHSGQEKVAITESQMPMHPHILMASATAADERVPSDSTVLANTGAINLYDGDSSNVTALSAAFCAQEGGGAAHENCQPSLALTFCIAVEGEYPHVDKEN